MARKPFVVIDAEILSSSIWSEAIHVRMVWFTMLVLCDTDGYVGASVPGIARAASVTLEQTEDALRILQAPDPHSRTKTDEGRRVREADRGFQILNFKDHLDRLSKERAKSRERMRRYRDKKRQGVTVTSTVTTGNRDQGVGNRDKTEERRTVPASVQEGGAGGRIEKRRRLVEEHPRETGESLEAHRGRIDALLEQGERP